MKISKAYATLSERIEIRRFDLASKAADVSPTHIVGHN
jgi:hypothetical protein